MVNINTVEAKDNASIPLFSTDKKGLEFRIIQHPRRPDHLAAFAICNDFGFICGGNLRAYIPTVRMRSFDYPTLFKSRVYTREWLASVLEYAIAEREVALHEAGYDISKSEEAK